MEKEISKFMLESNEEFLKFSLNTPFSPEHIKNGFFFDYVQYTIKTSPLGWAVKRRYNDFYWLRETLQKFHPGVFVPPIPKKKRKNRFREDIIRKRMYIFEVTF